MADNRYLKDSSEPPAEVQKEDIKPIAKATTKKKGFFRKTRDFLFSGDTRDVKDYIVEETIKPAIKDGIYEVIMSFIDGMLYGDGGGRRRRKKSSGSSYEKTSYTSYYKTANKYEEKKDRRREPEHLDLDCLWFEDDGPEVPRKDRKTGYEKAQDVEAGMIARIERYASGASVQDVYDFCGISCPEWNATEWGWTDADRFEKECYIRKKRGGAEMSLPPPKYLEE